MFPSELEVEFGIAPPTWAATDPQDPSIISAHVADGGLRALYDPEGIHARLMEACR